MLAVQAVAANSLFQVMISLFARAKFPVSLRREFRGNTLELLRDLMREGAKMAENFANSLLFSLFSGNSRITPNLPPRALHFGRI
jgi:hypothetical protein